MGTADALALISRLPRDQAEAVLLRVVMELDAESAARVLGKKSGSVRMAAHRGLKRLAKLLEQSLAAGVGIPAQRPATGPSGQPAQPPAGRAGPAGAGSAGRGVGRSAEDGTKRIPPRV